GRQIAVAEAEPGQAPVALEVVHHRPRLADQPPTRLRVHRARQGVDDRVDVGAHMQAVQHDVVARVDHRGHVPRLTHLQQPAEKAGGADASGQRGDHPAEPTPSVTSNGMEVAPRVDKLLAKAVDEQVSEQRLIREALEDFNARLARVEFTTATLAEKIEPWSD